MINTTKTSTVSGLKGGFTREGKTDFTPLFKEHKRVMNLNGGDIDNMIRLRQ